MKNGHSSTAVVFYDLIRELHGQRRVPVGYEVVPPGPFHARHCRILFEHVDGCMARAQQSCKHRSCPHVVLIVKIECVEKTCIQARFSANSP